MSDEELENLRQAVLRDPLEARFESNSIRLNNGESEERFGKRRFTNSIRLNNRESRVRRETR